MSCLLFVGRTTRAQDSSTLRVPKTYKQGLTPRPSFYFLRARIRHPTFTAMRRWLQTTRQHATCTGRKISGRRNLSALAVQMAMETVVGISDPICLGPKYGNDRAVSFYCTGTEQMSSSNLSCVSICFASVLYKFQAMSRLIVKTVQKLERMIGRASLFTTE